MQALPRSSRSVGVLPLAAPQARPLAAADLAVVEAIASAPGVRAQERAEFVRAATCVFEMVRHVAGDGAPITLEGDTEAASQMDRGRGGFRFRVGQSGLHGVLARGSATSYSEIPAMLFGFTVPKSYVANIAEPAADLARIALAEPLRRGASLRTERPERNHAELLRRAADVMQHVAPDGDIVIAVCTASRALYVLPASCVAGETPYMRIGLRVENSRGPGMGQIPAENLYTLEGYVSAQQIAAARFILDLEGDTARKPVTIRVEETDTLLGKPRTRGPKMREVLDVRLPGGTSYQEWEARRFIIEPTGEVWRSQADGYVFGDQGQTYWTTEFLGKLFGVKTVARAAPDAHLVEQQQRASALILAAAAKVSAKAKASAPVAVRVAQAAFPYQVLVHSLNPDGTLFIGPPSEMEPTDAVASRVIVARDGKLSWQSGSAETARVFLDGIAQARRYPAGAIKEMRDALDSTTRSASVPWSAPKTESAELAQGGVRFQTWVHASGNYLVQRAVDSSGSVPPKHDGKTPPGVIVPAPVALPTRDGKEPAYFPWKPEPPV